MYSFEQEKRTTYSRNVGGAGVQDWIRHHLNGVMAQKGQVTGPLSHTAECPIKASTLVAGGAELVVLPRAEFANICWVVACAEQMKPSVKRIRPSFCCCCFLGQKL